MNYENPFVTAFGCAAGAVFLVLSMVFFVAGYGAVLTVIFMAIRAVFGLFTGAHSV